MFSFFLYALFYLCLFHYLSQTPSLPLVVAILICAFFPLPPCAVKPVHKDRKGSFLLSLVRCFCLCPSVRLYLSLSSLDPPPHTHRLHTYIHTHTLTVPPKQESSMNNSLYTAETCQTNDEDVMTTNREEDYSVDSKQDTF